MKRFYLVSSLLMCLGLFVQAQTTYDVTFRVDMTEYFDGGGTIDATGMHVAGNFSDEAGLGDGMTEWTPSLGPMIQSMSDTNVWEFTVQLPDGDYEYKFVKGDDWPAGDEQMSGACASGTNRTLTVDGAAVDNAGGCWESCLPCGQTAPTVDVTFQVDMTNMLRQFQPGGDIISVAGAMQGWSPGTSVMTDMDGDSIYTITLEVDANGTYQYKYLFGNDWGYDEAVPGDCATSNNREFSVTTNDTTLGVVCFGSCEADCEPLAPAINVTFRVDMSDEIVSGDGVHIAGTFQFPAWVKDEIMLTESSTDPGIYEVTREIVPGGEIQYKFINGTGDANEEMADFIMMGCGIDNGVGGSNRLLDLTDVTDDITVGFVFNSCDELTTSVVNTTRIESYKVFPNPFTNQTRIEFSNPDNEVYDLQVADLTGKVVRSIRGIRGEQILVDRAGLANGLYIATLKDRKGGQLSMKLIVR